MRLVSESKETKHRGISGARLPIGLTMINVRLTSKPVSVAGRANCPQLKQIFPANLWGGGPIGGQCPVDHEKSRGEHVPRITGGETIAERLIQNIGGPTAIVISFQKRSSSGNCKFKKGRFLMIGRKNSRKRLSVSLRGQEKRHVRALADHLVRVREILFSALEGRATLG